MSENADSVIISGQIFDYKDEAEESFKGSLSKTEGILLIKETIDFLASPCKDDCFITSSGFTEKEAKSVLFKAGITTEVVKDDESLLVEIKDINPEKLEMNGFSI